MLKVSEILRVKGNTLYTATPDMPVQHAIETMSSHDIGSLVIMEHGTLVGMLTFREILRHSRSKQWQRRTDDHQSDHGRCTSQRRPPTPALTRFQRLMLDKHARYIPVMDGQLLMGVISFYDMAQAIVAAQQFENNMLKAYIRDWPEDKSGS